MVTIHPIKLTGNWVGGFALDMQTLSSEYLGDDEYGHPMFDTKRPEFGELVFRLKYRSDLSVSGDIIAVTADFLTNTWRITQALDGIIPIPPSKTDRIFQPVIEIAKGISVNLKLPLFQNALLKTKPTPELKNIEEHAKRTEILSKVLTCDSSLIKNKNLLLFDDLFGSGATFQIATKILYEQGEANKVYVLALAKKRT